MSDPSISNFRLQIFEGKQRTDPHYDTSGTGDGWRDVMRVRVPGFDGSATVDLAELWATALGERRSRLEQTVIGRETIVKLGTTMQLRPEFTAILEIEYRD